MRNTISRRRSCRFETLEPRHLLAGDPVAEWRFDSTSGTDLVDSVGIADGTITGSNVYNATATALTSVMPVWTASNPTQWGTGTRNGALRLFSDTDGAVVDASLAPQVQSVSLWFKADTTNPTRYNSSAANGGSTNGTPVAMPLFDVGDSSAGLNIYIYNSRLYVGAWNSAVANWSAGTFLASESNAIVAGRWHHVVVTLDPTASLTAGGLHGYLDAVEFGSGSAATVGGPANIGIGRTEETTRFRLGTSSSVVSNDSPASNNHRGFAGYLDEVRVYDETLSAADVEEIRTATGPTTLEEGWLIRDSGRAASIGRFRFAGQLASEHFVFKWGNDLPTAMQPVTTYIQQNLDRLEMSWDILVDQAGMLPPAARNGVNYKVNAYILDTGLWYVDSGGGTFSGAFSGPDPVGFAALYTSPWALAQFQNPRAISLPNWGTVANTTTTPHEFTHVLQSESGGFANSDYSGPFWEAHANFGASLVDAFDTGNYRAQITARNSIIGRYGERRHRYSLATDFRYQAHLFLNYLSEHPNYGPAFVTSGLWSDTDAQGSGKDPWKVLRNNFSSDAEFAAVYADFVAHTVTYKSFYGGALLTGLPAIPSHDTTDRLYRTYLEPVAVSPGWYQVPEQDTPEQYGANIVPLAMPDKVIGQAQTVTVNLDGYVNPGQANGLYATLVAVSGSGPSLTEYFSPTWESGELTWEVPADADALYLTVTAIPSVHRSYIWSHPFQGTGVGQKIERFPYRVSFSGAVPQRSEATTDRPAPSPRAVRHINPDGSLGGWKLVAVPATVTIGYNAWVTGGSVTGEARIEDYATVAGGSVQGSAIVRGHATIEGGTVAGNAVVEDYATIAGGSVFENAQVRGDARVNSGQIRGNSLVTDYATIGGGSTIVAGETVIKGYGVVDNAQMTGNALVMSSGLASQNALVTDRGVQYNGEPAAQEVPLMTTQYNNLFAQYNFATRDDNVVWDTFNTTYGWVSENPLAWQSSSTTGGNLLTGVLQFTSDDQFVELSPELSDLHDYTLQLWVRWEGTGDANQRIFEFGRDAENYMALQPTSPDGGVRFEFVIDGVKKELIGREPLTAGQWQHVAVTFSDETVKLYVNGSAVAVRTGVSLDPTHIRASYGLLGGGASAAGFRGAVSRLQVYSDARTSAELLEEVRTVYPGYVPAPDVLPGDFNQDGLVNGRDFLLWQRGQSPDPLSNSDLGDWQTNFGNVPNEPETERLVSHFQFEGNVLDDQGEFDGTASGAPSYTTGVTGQAIDLDGSNDFVQLPAGIVDFSELTVATWFYWDGGANWQRIFDFGNGTSQYLFLTPSSGSNTLRFAITIDGNGAEQVLETSALPAGHWFHVAVVLAGSESRLYVSGRIVDTANISLDPTLFQPVQNYIGKSQWPDPLFDGKIDDFRIYNYALSAMDVGLLSSSMTMAATLGERDQADSITSEAGTVGPTLLPSESSASSPAFTTPQGPWWMALPEHAESHAIPSQSISDDRSEPLPDLRSALESLAWDHQRTQERIPVGSQFSRPHARHLDLAWEQLSAELADCGPVDSAPCSTAMPAPFASASAAHRRSKLK